MRASAQGGTRGTYSQRNTNVVLPESVASDGFTFERVGAHQCVSDEQYTMPEQSIERTYFTKQAADALLCINQDKVAPKPLLFLKMVQAIKEAESDPDDLERVLALRSVMYGQLAKRPQPPMDNRRNIPGEEGDMPDELDKYTCFDVIGPKGGKEVAKRYVQAPQSEGGWFAEVFGTSSLKYHVTLDFQIDLGTFNDDEEKNSIFLRYAATRRARAC